ADRDDQAVQEVPAQVLVGEEGAVVLQRGRRREDRRGRVIRLAGRHQRGGDHPEQRPHGKGGPDQEQRVQQDRAEQAGHGTVSRRSRSWITVPARVSRNSTTAMAVAKPSRHQRNPSSYMRSMRVRVLLSGPPWVIT